MRTQDAPHDTRFWAGRPTLLACILACLLIVIAVGFQAPAISSGLRWKWTLRSSNLPPIEIEPLERGVTEFAGSTGGDSGMLARILAALIAVGILIWVARVIRRHARPSPAISLVAMGAEGGVPREADAKTVHTGLAAALRILESERDRGNAVVRAWQGLEEAAAAAGLDRRPAETTSEFTARILYRSRNSAVPIESLQSLYQRVRFGDHDPDTDEIASARDSLSALIGLWQTDLPSRKPPRRSR
jgi:hypothetical protein